MRRRDGVEVQVADTQSVPPSLTRSQRPAGHIVGTWVTRTEEQVHLDREDTLVLIHVTQEYKFEKGKSTKKVTR